MFHWNKKKLTEYLYPLNPQSEGLIDNLKDYEQFFPNHFFRYDFNVNCTTKENILNKKDTYISKFTTDIDLSESTIYINSEKQLEYQLISLILASLYANAHRINWPKVPLLPTNNHMDLLKYERRVKEHETQTRNIIDNIYQGFINNSNLVKPLEPVSIKYITTPNDYFIKPK